MRASSIIFALAAPLLASAAVIRDVAATNVAASMDVMDKLYTDIQQHTAIINSTMASISATSTAEQNTTAQNTIMSESSAISDLIATASNQMDPNVAASVIQPPTMNQFASSKNYGNSGYPLEGAEKTFIIIYELEGCWAHIAEKFGYIFAKTAFEIIAAKFYIFCAAVDFAFAGAFWIIKSWFYAFEFFHGAFCGFFFFWWAW